MDIFLLYLFTRVDALHSAIAGMMIPAILIAVISAGFLTAFRFINDEELAKHAIGVKKIFIISAIAWVFLGGMSILVPTQKDLAIIVGGYFTIEAAKSDTTKKVYQLVQGILDEESEKLAQRQKERSAR